jgi:hypothetical protein
MAVYQWYNQNVPIAGANQPWYEATDRGIYRVEVKDGDCTTLSVAENINRQPSSIEKPVVEVLPLSKTICDGSGIVRLRLINVDRFASGSAYQWYCNGKPVVGATDSLYITNNAGVYRVYVQEGTCGAFSAPDTITASMVSIEKPVITSFPSDAKVYNGKAVELYLNNITDYSTNISYYWMRGNTVVSNEAVLSTTEDGIYKLLLIDNDLCAGLSDTLRVETASCQISQPQLDIKPLSKNICGGNGSVRLSIANAAAYTSPVYQWYKDRDTIHGANAYFYTATEEGNYVLEVSDQNCKSYSATEEITKDNSFISLPAVSKTGAVICGAYGQVTLSLDNVQAYNNPVYQWYRNDTAVSGSVGATSSYTVTAAGVYKLQVISGNGCSVFSSDDTLRVDPFGITRPNVEMTPSSGSTGQVCGTDGRVIFTISNRSSFSPAANFVWYNNGIIVDMNQSGTLITQDPGHYYVKVIDGNCSTLSDTGEVVVDLIGSIAPAVIDSRPSGNIVCGVNGTVMLSLTNNVSAYTAPVYQWYKNGIAIANADSSVYQATDSGLYYLFITDGTCGTASNSIYLDKNNSIVTKPVLSKNPNTSELCTNGDILLSVTNTFSNAVYVWYRGSEIVQNSTLSTYRANTEGNYYVQVIEGGCSSVSLSETLTRSQTGSMTVPIVSSLPSSNTICGANGVVTLTLTNASAYNSPVCQWYKDSVAIFGATNTMYRARTAGVYSIHVTAGNCSGFADVVITYDNTPIDIPIIHASGQICGSFGSVMLKVGNYTNYSNAEYIWYRGNVEIQRGTSEIYIAAQAGDYTVQVIEGNCSSISTAHTLTLSPSIISQAQISSLSGNTKLCGVNGVVVLSLDNENDFNQASYQWYRYGEAILQATEVVYTANDTGEYRLIVTDGNCTSVSNIIYVTTDMTGIDIPVITSNPANGNIYGGTSVYLSIQNETDFSSPTYLWYRDASVSAGTQKDLTTNIAGKYRLLVMEGDCSAWSNEITLQDTACSVPVGAIADTAICEGASADLSLIAYPLSANSEVRFYGDRFGVTPLSSPVVSPQATTTYYVRFADTVTLCESDIYSLIVTINKAPILVSSLHGGIICSGDVFTYSAVSDYPNVNYQWKRLPNPAINRGDSAVGTSQAIREILTNTSLNSVTVSYEFILTPADGSCSTASPIEMIVEVLPADHTQVQLLNEVCYGDTMVSIPYQTQQTASMEYKIYYGGEALGAGFVPMSQFDTLLSSPIEVRIPNTAVSGTYAGTIEIRIGTCVTEYPFSIVIADKPVIADMSASTYYCEGDIMTLTVTANGGNLLYQWYYEGNPIAGATSATYEEIFLSSMAGEYYVEISNACTTVTGKTIEIGSNDIVVVDTKWEDIIYVNGVGQNYVRYQWYKNGKPIAEQSSSQYYVDPDGLVGDYHVRVYFADGTYQESCPVTLNLQKVTKNLLYPTPVPQGDMYTIELEHGDDNDRTAIVEVYDATGRLVDKHVMEGTTIEIQASYARGAYSVRIVRSNGEVVVKRLIVE